MESSAASRNALLSTMDNVASPSNGRKSRITPTAAGFRAGTMQRYWSLGSISTLPLPRWIL
jgi:hypothetical protein